MSNIKWTRLISYSGVKFDVQRCIFHYLPSKCYILFTLETNHAMNTYIFKCFYSMLKWCFNMLDYWSYDVNLNWSIAYLTLTLKFLINLISNDEFSIQLLNCMMTNLKGEIWRQVIMNLCNYNHFTIKFIFCLVNMIAIKYWLLNESFSFHLHIFGESRTVHI